MLKPLPCSWASWDRPHPSPRPLPSAGARASGSPREANSLVSSASGLLPPSSSCLRPGAASSCSSRTPSHWPSGGDRPWAGRLPSGVLSALGSAAQATRLLGGHQRQNVDRTHCLPQQTSTKHFINNRNNDRKRQDFVTNLISEAPTRTLPGPGHGWRRPAGENRAPGPGASGVSATSRALRAAERGGGGLGGFCPVCRVTVTGSQCRPAWGPVSGKDQARWREGLAWGFTGPSELEWSPEHISVGWPLRKGTPLCGPGSCGAAWPRGHPHDGPVLAPGARRAGTETNGCGHARPWRAAVRAV